MKALNINNLPDEIQKTNFRALDGLRGVSAILVIISHVVKAFQVRNNYIGGAGVDVFFVISGFLITTLLLKERLKYGNISLKGFYIRRCFRILPVAFLYLIVLFCLNVIYKLNIQGSSFLTCLLFVKNLPIGQHSWYTAHFWSLGIEEQFYLIFPFFIVSLSLLNYKRLILCLVVGLLLLTFVYTRRLDTDLFHVPPAVHFIISGFYKLLGGGTLFILVGSLFSVLLLTQNMVIHLVYAKAPAFSSLLLFIIAIIFFNPRMPGYVPHLTETIFAIIISFVIILNLKERSFFSRLLEHDLLKKVGVLSYSLYIWQELFTYKQPWYNAGTNIFLIILNLTALFVVSWLSYSLYERKFLSYKNHFKRV